MWIEEKLQTPVTETPHVLVCGGGIAGIAAAVAAARAGRQVLLLERGFMLGGLATAGLITIYLPLCDGMGRQVSFGLAEELLRLSIAEVCDGKLGYDNWIRSDDPAGRGEKSPRFEVNFNPHLFAIAAEQLLFSLGVKILYGTTVVAAQRDGRVITAVMAENKSGRFAIAPGNVIDATGDADIAHLAGAPTALFGQGNILAAWYYTAGHGGYDLHTLGFADIPDSEKKKKKGPALLVDRRFGGLDGGEISEMMMLSHASTLSDYRRRRAQEIDLELATIATVPQLRMTRRISGAYTLNDGEVHTPFADSVGLISDWRRRGPVWEVPYRTLYSPDVANLITAGRCTSVTDGMWDVTRVIPCCAVTGEAAGLAAALTNDFATLDVALLQGRLAENGVVLHERDLSAFTPKTV